MPNNTMLYRHPGAHKVDGVTFDYLIVLDEDIPASLKDGWSMSVAEAKAAAGAAPSTLEVVKSLAALADAVTAPPTRAELEQKATELGIKFDGRTGDKKLSALIAEKVAP